MINNIWWNGEVPRIDNTPRADRERMERDAMAWQVFLAKQSQDGAQGTDTEAREAYSAVDAFLYERKRQQGEA